MHFKVVISLLLTAGLFTFSVVNADPRCEEDACFPQSVTVGGNTLVRSSKVRYRYYVFSVFNASVYLPSKELLSSDFIGNHPMALRLCYLRDMSAEDFRKSGYETLELNPNQPVQLFAKEIDALHPKYEAMGEGDCYQLNFLPKVGLELMKNDKSVVTVNNDDFAKAYLGIWLSQYSFSSSVAEQLKMPLKD